MNALQITDIVNFARGKEPQICYPRNICLLKIGEVYKHIYVDADGRCEESNTLRYREIKEDGTLGIERTIFPIPDVYTAPGAFMVCLTVHKIEPTQLREIS